MTVCRHCGLEIKPCPIFSQGDTCQGFIHLSQFHYCKDGKHMAEPAPAEQQRTDRFGRCLGCGLKDYHQDVNGKPCPYAPVGRISSRGAAPGSRSTSKNKFY